MIISNKHIKNGLNWAGKCIHSPEQRLILGATALMTQPVIDLCNKKVDEDTRKISVARTLAKIVAGTAVGVLVRQAGIWWIQKYSKYACEYVKKDGKTLVSKIIPDKKRGFFVPLFTKPLKENEKAVFPIEESKLDKKFNLYRKAMGTFVATVAMIGTNFLLDAPITKFLTGVFQKQIMGDAPSAKEMEGSK